MPKKKTSGGAVACKANAGRTPNSSASVEQVTDWLVDNSPATARGLKVALRDSSGMEKVEDLPGTILDARNAIMAWIRAGYRPISGPFAQMAA
ncbi:MAG: hypothetical protein P4L61_03895 [Candidatus Pacebacteria bacterium]|nr:hypothetical protein [Candidatus Paceibacterota bacterium]